MENIQSSRTSDPLHMHRMSGSSLGRSESFTTKRSTVNISVLQSAVFDYLVEKFTAKKSARAGKYGVKFRNKCPSAIEQKTKS